MIVRVDGCRWTVADDDGYCPHVSGIAPSPELALATGRIVRDACVALDAAWTAAEAGGAHLPNDLDYTTIFRTGADDDMDALRAENDGLHARILAAARALGARLP